jgi:YidC/Oxa1 family membrane protein insertase
LNLLALPGLLQFPNPLIPPLERMLQWLNDAVAPLNPIPELVGSYAIALVLVAILVKVVTYPLTVSQMRSMRNMQALQPKMRELQERHKGDREKLGQAQMELYREEGVNPFGGCLPLIITMVVLFSLYGAITSLQPQMEGQPFFWIQNIAVCEPNPMCPALPLGVPFLVILMVLSQVLYQKYLTPPSTDPQAKAMNATMKFMPLIFGVFFLTLPAALVLYYFVFNLVSIVQQVFINRQLGPKTMELSVPVVGDASGSPAPAPDLVEEQPSHERGESRRRRRKKGA